jgi:putative intracellular protease/amidase
MNVAIYLYDGYFETELCIATMLFKKENLFVLSSGEKKIRCMDGRHILVDKTINEVSSDDIDVLIIPGGSPIIKEDILSLIRSCHKKGAVMGGICGGVDYFAHAGVLEGKRYTSYYENDKEYAFLPKMTKPTYEMYESSNNIVTASPEAYLEFAMELARCAGILENDAIENLVSWFKKECVFKMD